MCTVKVAVLAMGQIILCVAYTAYIDFKAINVYILSIVMLTPKYNLIVVELLKDIR